jgi:hypothetical protein
MLVGGVRPYARFFIQLKKISKFKVKDKGIKRRFLGMGKPDHWGNVAFLNLYFFPCSNYI